MTEPSSNLDTLASLPEATAAARTSKALYRAALGPVNAGHYLALFDRFDAAGRAGLVWNPAAGLCTLPWLVFRRLWAMTAVYLAVVAALLLAWSLLAPQLSVWPTGVVAGLLVSLVLVAMVVPGLVGNAVLHAHTRQRVVRAVAGAPSLGDACLVLEQEASSRLWLQTVAVGTVLLLAALGFAMWSPQGLSGPASAPVAEKTPGQPSAVAAPQAGLAPAVKPPPTVNDKPTEPVNPPSPAEQAPAPVFASSVSALASADGGSRTVADPPASAGAPAKVEATPSTPAPVVKPVVAAADPGQKPQPAAVAPGAYAINAGMFAESANAERVHAQLLAAGLPAYTQRVEGTKGVFTRVRVGPFAGSEQATEAVERIRAIGLEAQVYRP